MVIIPDNREAGYSSILRSPYTLKPDFDPRITVDRRFKQRLLLTTYFVVGHNFFI